jgi:hypothetical protein
MTISRADDWKERAQAAFGRYLAAVEEDLAEDAGVVEIETAMLEHYREMMSETLQALADSQGLSPQTQARNA